MHLRQVASNEDSRDSRLLAALIEDTLDLQRTLTALLADLKKDHSPARRLAIRNNGQILFLKAEEIEWIDASGNYVRLNAAGESHLLRETMAGVEAKLPSDRFVRIHRSTIVNVDAVRELLPKPHGDFVVVLTSGKRLAMSRGYRDKLEESLGITL
jgi:two-component system LytT family response regulator